MGRPKSAATVEAVCKRCGETKQLRLRTRTYQPTGTSWTKPEPYCDTCLGQYRKAALRRRLGLAEDAVLVRRPPAADRSKIQRHWRDPGTPRVCTGCKVLKAGSEFESYHDKKSGKIATRAMCRPCARDYRRKNIAKNRALERAGLKPVKPDFMCRVCKVNRVTNRRGRCVSCYRAALRSDLLNAPSPPTRNPSPRDGVRPSPPVPRTPPPRKGRAFEDEGVYFAERRAALLKRKQAAAERGERTGYGIIFLNDTEWWTPGFKCGSCTKGIIAFGLCYTCATGMERSVLRPAERAMA